jgi:branched-chain amino acid transport system substrate-binding protein
MVNNRLIRPKTVILIITGVSKEQLSIGVEVRFTGDNKLVALIVSGLLPTLPRKLLDTYSDWKRSYLLWGKTYRYWQRTITAPNNPIETNVSIQDCDVLEEKLIREFNYWLAVDESPGLANVAMSLIANVAPSDYQDRPELLSFVVQTRTSNSQLDLDLQKLPWNEWGFIRSHYNSGIALSTDTAPIIERQHQKLKALVICGKYEELDNQIDLQPDLDAVQQYLSDVVELETWICNSTKSKLELLKKLDNSTYHLLFFCGHSSSNNQIQLNDCENISADDPRFKAILNKLKNKGLILAFFNSCDGSGIAHSLTKIGIPYVVVMKELVHDRVAQEFIKEFLEQAVRPENPVHIAVHKARQKLQWLEEIPHGEFLPVLFQNPEQPPLYLNLQSIATVEKSAPIPNRLSRWIKYLVIASISAIVMFANPALQHWFWSWNSPPICKFTNEHPNIKISCGEKILFRPPGGEASDNKKNGFDSIQKGLNNPLSYQKAIELLRKDWKSNHDPETAIAIENAAIAQQVAQNPTMKVKNIAIVVPAETNTPSYIADSMLKGVAYAQQEHNRNPNRDWKLRVIIADDGNSLDKEKAPTIALILADHKDILGIIGHYSSYVTVPIVNNQKTYEGKVVLISPTATSHKLTNSSKFFFRLVSPSAVSARSMVKRWVKPQYKIVLFYQPDREFSSSLAKAFEDEIKREYPSNKIIIRKVNLTKSDNIKNELTQAKKAGANAIVLFPDAYTGAKKDNLMAEKVIKDNDGKMPILSNTSIYDLYDEKSQVASTSIKVKLYRNLVISIPWDYQDTINGVARYSDKLIPKDDPNMLPDIPTWWLTDKSSIGSLNERIAMSYDSAVVMIQALNKADDRISVQKELSHSSFRAKGITGSISFEGSERKEEMNSLVIPNCGNTQCNGLKPYVGK